MPNTSSPRTPVRVRPTRSTNGIVRMLDYNTNNDSVTSSPRVVAVNMKLPVNIPDDPISFTEFKKGNTAIMVTQRGKRAFFEPTSFNGWFGDSWKTMNPESNAVIHNRLRVHPLTRNNVTRNQVKKVKFV